MNEEMNVVAEEGTKVVQEIVPQVVKAKPDLVKLGVKGLCIWGAVSFVGAVAIGGKKLYNHFSKKKVEEPEEVDPNTSEDTTETQNNQEESEK